MSNENNITIITADEHERLCSDSATLWNMVGMILESATLNYRKDALCFSDGAITAAIKTVDANGYRNKLHELLDQLTEKEAE